MKKFVSGKCPDCGATLQLDSGQTSVFCSYCGNKISVEESVEKLKLELSGSVEVDGINSVKKLYKNAESYIKLQDFNSALKTYRSIINNNPEEIPAYKGALIAASHNMTLRGNPQKAYPSDYSSLFNTYLDYIKKLDTNSEYADFVTTFTSYFNEQARLEKDTASHQAYLKRNNALYAELKEHIKSLKENTKDLKKHNFSSTDYYSFYSVNNEYQTIMNLYNQLDDEYKARVTDIEDIKNYYKKASKKQGFLSHGIGKVIKWYFWFWVVSAVIGAIVGIIQLISRA